MGIDISASNFFRLCSSRNVTDSLIILTALNWLPYFIFTFATDPKAPLPSSLTKAYYSRQFRFLSLTKEDQLTSILPRAPSAINKFSSRECYPYATPPSCSAFLGADLGRVHSSQGASSSVASRGGSLGANLWKLTLQFNLEEGMACTMSVLYCFFSTGGLISRSEATFLGGRLGLLESSIFPIDYNKDITHSSKFAQKYEERISKKS